METDVIHYGPKEELNLLAERLRKNGLSVETIFHSPYSDASLVLQQREGYTLVDEQVHRWIAHEYPRGRE